MKTNETTRTDDLGSVFSAEERAEIVRRQAEPGILEWFRDELGLREEGLEPRRIPSWIETHALLAEQGFREKDFRARKGSRR
jgi:hypothetical protein